MLHEFLTANRTELIDRCKAKVVLRPARMASEASLEHGIPQFLDQLARTLEREQAAAPIDSRGVLGSRDGADPTVSEISGAATLHGRELLRQGFTVDQVVHDYGDLCQAITELASERNAPIEVLEFRTLNRCLDDAIADAVTEFSYERDVISSTREREANERQGHFMHELKSLLDTAKLAFLALKTGDVGMNGSTGMVLDRSLNALSRVVERSLGVRMVEDLPVTSQLLSLADFIARIEASATLDAQARECVFTVPPVDPTLAIDVDREPMESAVLSLLSNAFRFTARRTEVRLSAYVVADRILIEVSDACGGLAHGVAESLVLPFSQGSADRAAPGLGLAIARRSIEANGGILRVRDLPGTGCIFTVDLPRHLVVVPPVVY